jgi:hypothetical protein
MLLPWKGNRHEVLRVEMSLEVDRPKCEKLDVQPTQVRSVGRRLLAVLLFASSNARCIHSLLPCPRCTGTLACSICAAKHTSGYCSAGDGADRGRPRPHATPVVHDKLWTWHSAARTILFRALHSGGECATSCSEHVDRLRVHQLNATSSGWSRACAMR